MNRFILFLRYTALMLSFVFSCGAQVSAQTNTGLQGQLGAFPIALYIGCDKDGSCYDSHYFYTRTAKDIPLEGKRSGNHFTLTTRSVGDDAPDEVFELQSQGDVYYGTWKNKKGKSLPVKLSVIRPGTIKNPYENMRVVKQRGAKDATEYLRTSLLDFARDSVSKYKEKEIVWMHERKSGAPLFRLGNGFSEAKRARVNPMLDNLHIENALDKLGCSSPFGEGEMDFTVSITYLDNDLLGFSVSAYYDCGGAHPDGGSSGYLFDLNKGVSYSLDDVLAFDPSVTTEERSGFDAFDKYRTTFLAPRLEALLAKAHHFTAPGTADDCDYRDVEIWNFPSWAYTEKGIEFTPIFARVMRNCEEPFLLSFTQLQAYRNHAFPYPFPGDKK